MPAASTMPGGRRMVRADRRRQRSSGSPCVAPISTWRVTTDDPANRRRGSHLGRCQRRAGSVGPRSSIRGSIRSGRARRRRWVPEERHPRRCSDAHDDRGQSWQRVEVGTSSSLLGCGPSIGIACSSRRRRRDLGTADGGAHWTALFSDPRMVLFGIWAPPATTFMSWRRCDRGDGDAGANAPDGGTAPDGGADATTTYAGWSCTRPMAGELADRRGRGHSVPAAARVRHPDGATVYAAGDCGSVPTRPITALPGRVGHHGRSRKRQRLRLHDLRRLGLAGRDQLSLEDGSGYVNPIRRMTSTSAAPSTSSLTAPSHTDHRVRASAASGGSAPPDGRVGTADDDVWIVGFSILWHRS